MSFSSHEEGVQVRRPRPREDARQRAFIGKVYSQYRDRGPKSERIICVTTPSGSGIGLSRAVRDGCMSAKRKSIVIVCTCLTIQFYALFCTHGRSSEN